jgi:trehalose 6-phosphate synthase/phosphatase
VNPARYLDGFSWDEFKWRRGELVAQFAGLTVLVGCDDLDVFKVIACLLESDG